MLIEFGDDEMEQVREHDGSADDVLRYGPQVTEDVYHCVIQDHDRIGVGEEAGAGCPKWTAGSSGAALPDALLRRMAEIAAKADAEMDG